MAGGAGEGGEGARTAQGVFAMPMAWNQQWRRLRNSGNTTNLHTLWGVSCAARYANSSSPKQPFSSEDAGPTQHRTARAGGPCTTSVRGHAHIFTKWEDLSGGQGPVPQLLRQELPLEPPSRDHRPCHTWSSPAPGPDPQNTINLSFLGSVFWENLLRSHSWLGQALEVTASLQPCTTELLG